MTFWQYVGCLVLSAITLSEILCLVFILKRLPCRFAESQSKISILLCSQNQSLRRSILAVPPCTALVPIKNWRFWMSTCLVVCHWLHNEAHSTHFLSNAISPTIWFPVSLRECQSTAEDATRRRTFCLGYAWSQRWFVGLEPNHR